MSGGDAVELEPRVLQRVIFPTDSNLDIVPLYVETDLERGADRAAPAEPSSEVTNAVLGATQSSVRFGSHDQPATAQRFVATIRGGRRVSFATYFNAFPASYWRRWTVVESVTLRVRLEGSATIVVYRSTANGHSHPVRTVEVDSGDVEVIDVHLPLTQFVDGGWYWFDVAAGPDGATLLQADWLALVPPRPTGTLSIGITTYNRPGFLVDLLRSIGGAPDVLERLDAVYVVDQGTDQVTDHVDFADAAKGLGDRLEVIVQGNLGGSGGFSRAMHETLQAAVSDYVVLLDDDVVLEPEGLLRAVTFADLARRPTIVGGHMFSLHDRSVLHAFGETVSPYKWWWGAAPPGRRRLQRVVDVPHPHPDHRRARPRVAGVHQVGRRRVRAPGAGSGLPDGVDAGRRGVACAVVRQE
jgi:galactofuranosylgalactofuranosylrhamnosyl-N-acetylglucosaminyl-diphospho-decaprenol beta-1,5/1,6-galactofuranosyltransferase